MYSREQIEKIVGKWYDSITEYHPGDDIHVCDMLEGIQDYLLYNKPPSKFMQFCAEEKWDVLMVSRIKLIEEFLKPPQYTKTL